MVGKSDFSTGGSEITGAGGVLGGTGADVVVETTEAESSITETAADADADADFCAAVRFFPAASFRLSLFCGQARPS